MAIIANRIKTATTPEEFYKELDLEDRTLSLKVIQLVKIVKEKHLSSGLYRSLLGKVTICRKTLVKVSGVSSEDLNKAYTGLPGWDNRKLLEYFNISESEFNRKVEEFRVRLKEQGILVVSDIEDVSDPNKFQIIYPKDINPFYSKCFP